MSGGVTAAGPSMAGGAGRFRATGIAAPVLLIFGAVVVGGTRSAARPRLR